MGTTGFLYKFFFLLHLSLVVVGFGSSFIYPLLSSRAKGLSPKEAYAVNHTAFSVSKYITTFPIYAAGAFGIALVIVSDEVFKFSQQWVSIAFLLFIIGIVFSYFVHTPNLKAIDELNGRLVSGSVDGTPGTPKEVKELEERNARVGMYGGILHLIFLLLMIDMIWKPGLGY